MLCFKILYSRAFDGSKLHERPPTYEPYRQKERVLAAYSGLSFSCCIQVLSCLESRPLEWRSAGTGLCSYRVRGVDGSCAKHLTIECCTVVMLLTFILIIISIPSPLSLSFQA